VNIKAPAVYDISHWKEVLDFSTISPRPALVITKASEAYPGAPFNHTDDKFVRFFDGMAKAGIRRGAYHFFRKGYDAVKQAQHFVNIIKPNVHKLDILALDIEEGGETAAQIIEFCDYVQGRYPDNIFLIYSAKWILDQVVMNERQKDRLKRIPVWIAGYPYYPDMFDKVPVGYIPNQSKWGNVWLWQYSEKGVVKGIQGAVDLNWIDPVFYEIIKDDGTLPPNDGTFDPPQTGDKMSYEMTTIYNEMRIRADHNTYAEVLLSVNANITVQGDELWTAPAGGAEVYANDQWMHITYGGVTGWMALTHKGKAYCKDFKIINEYEPDPTPPSTETYMATIEDKSTGEVWSGILSKQ